MESRGLQGSSFRHSTERKSTTKGSSRELEKKLLYGRSCLSRKESTNPPLISCGTVHTPQLLMLSGIGPASHLAEHNIPVIFDAQGIGSNLSDHPSFHLRLAEKMGISLAYLAADNAWATFKFWRNFLQYQFMGTGPFSSNVCPRTYTFFFSVTIDIIAAWRSGGLRPFRRPKSFPSVRIQASYRRQYFRARCP